MVTTYAILSIVTAWQANEAGQERGLPGLTCQAAKIGLPVGSTAGTLKGVSTVMTLQGDMVFTETTWNTVFVISHLSARSFAPR
jgi:hypothetical protein